MSKRKHVFRDDYEKEFANVKQSQKGKSYAHCCYCDSEINLEAMGETAISAHNATTRHKNNARSIASNQSMKNFFTSRTSPNNLDYKAAGAEGAWAFHTAKHQQSFFYNDCTTHLIKAIFSDSDVAKKFTSARTKIASIVTGVLAPFAQKSLLSELGENPFSISIDASNHNEVKLFPLVVRFFSAKVGVRVRILDLRSMPYETSQQIMNFICSSLEENGLKLENITSFCADNAPVNFGGCQQKGKNNVFNRLQEKNSARLIPIGCPAHILHNAAEKGAERLTVDIETIVLKICSHFKCQTSRVQKLKQFCAQLEAQYTALPTHTPTRWTTLGNVLEKMIELWELLTQHFLSPRCPPRILENFFRSEESLVFVSFLHRALSVFKKPLLLLQSTSALFPEPAEIFKSFKTAIFQRRNTEFYGAKTDELLKGIDSDCAEVLKLSFKEFYEVTLEYIDKWYRPDRHPANVAWTLLRNWSVTYEEVKEMAKKVDPEVAMADELFDEVSSLNDMLENIPVETFNEDSPETKWMKFFSENDSLPLLYKLVAFVFSIPVSNAFVERVFSLVSS